MLFILCALAGLAGAAGMFCGDMLLYFTRGSYDMDGTLKPYAAIMKKVTDRRLAVGGALGPVCAFLYCCGFFHLYLAAGEGRRALTLAVCLLLCGSIIVGGAYHSQYTALGFAAKYGSEEALEKIGKNILRLSAFATYPLLLGCVGIAVLIAAGWTELPRWLAVFSPAVTLLLNFIWLKVPQPFRVVLFGGWYSLVFVIYYLAVLLWAIL